jgi:hypothetical protein
MTNFKLKATFCATFVAGLLLGPVQHETSVAGISIALPVGISAAEAGPVVRSNRRQARRYYYSLPKGCVARTVAGVLYSYCGGIYYQNVIDDDGKTAYIIVTP